MAEKYEIDYAIDREEIDYDQLLDLAGLDGHTPRYTYYDGLAALRDPRRFWGSLPSIGEIRDSIDRDTLARIEAEAVKIIDYIPPLRGYAAACAPYRSQASIYCDYYPYYVPFRGYPR